jgi:RNA polymerase sigma factor (TIGR02999 family)
MDPDRSVTEWLLLWREGDNQALDRITALVYQDLRRMAAWYLAGESNSNTFQATALVHEAYLRVSTVRDFDWKERGQFMAVVAQMMRRILVDHARARNAAKRDATRFTLPSRFLPNFSPLDMLAVDQALGRMTTRYPRCGQIVELRLFGDLDFSEIAQLLDISLATVERDWRFSRAWLQKQISSC